MKQHILVKLFALLVIFATVTVSCQREDMIDNRSPIPTKVLPYLYQNQALSINLIGGQNIDVGDIILTFDETNLYIKYKTTSDWMIDEIHLWIGQDISYIPMNPGKNPKLGHFPYKAENIGDDEYIVTVPLSVLGGYPAICDETFYVAAHADVYKYTNEGELQETAWGEGESFAKGSWAMYFGFTFYCEDTPPVGCNTAFGFGGQTFQSLGIGNNWGWVITLNQEGAGSTDLHAGAGQNIIGPNTLVGTLNWNYAQGLLTVQFVMNAGWVMNETHLYASHLPPTTSAPGQYGNTHSLNEATTDTYQIQISGGVLPVYMIAHAVVCPE